MARHQKHKNTLDKILSALRDPDFARLASDVTCEGNFHA
ncbi:hypothetical protein B0G73_120100 [Paraburkholderia sp. BL25I1N1]|nr:hypothetical protein B0G73_120100 [Paraburkholderia sp. BL25I1N1]